VGGEKWEVVGERWEVGEWRCGTGKVLSAGCRAMSAEVDGGGDELQLT
jgi:hypothetical protein